VLEHQPGPPSSSARCRPRSMHSSSAPGWQSGSTQVLRTIGPALPPIAGKGRGSAVGRRAGRARRRRAREASRRSTRSSLGRDPSGDRPSPASPARLVCPRALGVVSPSRTSRRGGNRERTTGNRHDRGGGKRRPHYRQFPSPIVRRVVTMEREYNELIRWICEAAARRSAGCVSQLIPKLPGEVLVPHLRGVHRFLGRTTKSV